MTPNEYSVAAGVQSRQALFQSVNSLGTAVIGRTWSDNGEISEREKAIIEARLDEYDQNPETGSSWEEAKARVLAGPHAK